jgi:hypothetical protein
VHVTIRHTKDAKDQINTKKKAKKLANQRAKLASKVTVKKKTTTKTLKKAAIVQKKSVQFVEVAAEGVGPKIFAKATSCDGTYKMLFTKEGSFVDCTNRRF